MTSPPCWRRTDNILLQVGARSAGETIGARSFRLCYSAYKLLFYVLTGQSNQLRKFLPHAEGGGQPAGAHARAVE